MHDVIVVGSPHDEKRGKFSDGQFTIDEVLKNSTNSVCILRGLHRDLSVLLRGLLKRMMSITLNTLNTTLNTVI